MHSSGAALNSLVRDATQDGSFFYRYVFKNSVATLCELVSVLQFISELLTITADLEV